jgi:hypothetical protein
MLLRRLRSESRAPSAEAIGKGYVKGRRLAFDKISRDGSGKCDAQFTGVETDRVFGILFEIARSEKSALEDAEGVGNGYREEILKINTPEGEVSAIAYIATAKEPVLRPYHWYKALVIAGAVEHDLPRDYIEWIRAFESQEDPNPERRAPNEAILFTS